MRDKDKTFWAVLKAAIELDVTRGHLKWKMSELARASKVNRSLIYYYFGRERRTILIEAIRMFGEHLAGTEQTQMGFWKREAYAEAILETKKLFKRVPHLLMFYFINRDSDSEVGELIRSYEKKGVQKRKKLLKGLDDSKARAVFALQMGVSVFAPIQSAEDIAQALSMIKFS